MLEKAGLFCGSEDHRVREEQAHYFIDPIAND
jgi:hypothetical protein